MNTNCSEISTLFGHCIKWIRFCIVFCIKNSKLTQQTIGIVKSLCQNWFLLMKENVNKKLLYSQKCVPQFSRTK